MKRITKTKPGHDCMFAPCQHATPGEHGIHGDEWIYASVSNDGLTALTLTVYTDHLPSTVPAAHRLRCDQHFTGRPKTPAELREGADITLHCAFTTDREEIRLSGTGDTCEYVGQCFTEWTSGIEADRFFRVHGDPAQRDQPESFWQAFEAEHTTRGEKARANRADAKCKQCPTCKGEGVVGQ